MITLMDYNFKNNSNFQSLINSKQDLIKDKTSDEILESEGFKILFSGLKSMITQNDFASSKV